MYYINVSNIYITFHQTAFVYGLHFIYKNDTHLHIYNPTAKNSENILKIPNFILVQEAKSFVFLFNFPCIVAKKLLSFYVRALNAILLFYGRLRKQSRNRRGMKTNQGFILDKRDDR